MENHAATGKATKASSWDRKLWTVLGLLFALYASEQNVESLLYGAHLQPGSGYTGAKADPSPNFAPGYLVARSVEPGSPMADAGVVPGDHLRFEYANDAFRVLTAGEAVSFTLDHSGVKSHQTILAAPIPPIASAKRRILIMDRLVNFLPILLGAFLVARSLHQPSTRFLGIALIAYGTSFAPHQWESARAIYPFFEFFGFALSMNFYYAFPAFAIRFAEETVQVSGKLAWRLLWVALAVGFGYGFTTIYREQHMLQNSQVGGLCVLVFGLSVSFGIAFRYIYLGLRRSSKETRKRYALMIAAVSSMLLGEILMFGVFLSHLAQWNLDWMYHQPLYWVCDAMVMIFGPCLLAYAIFRQKVFDLGFAFNRAVVYGVISFGVLFVFGLVEWGSEHLIPKETLESSAIINAAVALLIFLIFHRVHHTTEHYVEKLIFRKWHDNEARLRRFVREAGFATKPQTLTESFVAELERFSGSEAAVFLRSEAGAEYIRVAGTLASPQAVDLDDPIALRMTADHTSVVVTETTSTLHAELALPMVQRGELSGFILLGTKPSGESYRPDEQEVLTWAVQRIGLDLHALKVLRLESKLSLQEQELALLHARYEEQRSAFNQISRA